MVCLYSNILFDLDGKGIILSQSKLPDVDDDEEDDGMADAADYYEHEFGDYGAEIPEDEGMMFFVFNIYIK